MVGTWENVDFGVKRKIYPPGKTLMMMEVHFETGAIGAEHSHPHEQFTYCLKGKLEFNLGGEKVLLQQGESLFIPGNVVHGVKALEASALLDTFTPLREDLLV
ncbi:cupin domain-containing protein [Sutcliffiella horikoshii]|uniref:cupin domain-containing protein n=1 Tax=Sutcliffiella horikoshii TaxID=79883 RepID=UPI001F31D29B|nr:cupin domain-containing protein [Sutcliffiella horikoshii]MCG1021860.1 cupin domain-containing protein [Sutcliffiella horikoshii]